MNKREESAVGSGREEEKGGRREGKEVRIKVTVEEEYEGGRRKGRKEG